MPGKEIDIKGIKKDLEDKLSFATADTTKKRYTQAITSCLKYLGKSKPSREEIIRYMNYLKRKGYSGTYLNFVFYALRKYFDVYNYEWEFKVKEAPKPSHPNRPIISREIAEKLLDMAKKNSKDYAILRLAITTGMRRAEIVNLMKEDYVSPKLYIRTLKGGESRSIELDKETVNAFNEYLASRKDDNPSLFKILTPEELSDWFRDKYADKLGLKKGFGIHSIRRALTTWLYEGGLSELEIQDYMGWKSSNMLHTYIRLDQKQVQDKVKRIHPFIK